MSNTSLTPEGKHKLSHDGMLAVLFGIATLILFIYGAGVLIYERVQGRLKVDKIDSFHAFLGLYPDIVTSFMFAILAAFLAIRFSSSYKASASTAWVIRPEDRDLLTPLISSGKSESINEYIRLASLSGFSGGFTKLGFGGLPLATIGIFVGLVMLRAVYGVDPEEKFSDALIDMAKMTLGAFIGSFVQRSVEQQRAVDTAQQSVQQVAQVAADRAVERVSVQTPPLGSGVVGSGVGVQNR